MPFEAAMATTTTATSYASSIPRVAAAAVAATEEAVASGEGLGLDLLGNLGARLGRSCDKCSVKLVKFL